MSLEDTLYPLLRAYESAPQPLRSVLGAAYRLLPASLRHGSEYLRFQRETQAVEQWDATAIRSYQLSALRATLAAASRAPLYAERFAAAGVDPLQLHSLEQLQSFPFTTKDDLRTQRERLLNPAFAPQQRLYLTTGGSSGAPVGFYLHKGVSRAKEQAYLEAQWARFGYAVGDKVAVLRGGVTSSHAAGPISSYDATRDWLILSSYHLTPQRLPDYVAALNHFRPRHLLAYPSSMLRLMQLGLRLDFQLTSILCGSEPLDAASQDQLQQHFGAPVMHWYGHSERVVLAAQTPDSRLLHFWPTYGFVEFGPPDAEGRCEIIGTSFHNHVMPLVRYRTGDYAVLPSPSASEPPWPVAQAIVGRGYEFLVSSQGRRVSLTALNLHTAFFTQVLALQFRQQQPGRVQVCYVPSPTFAPDTLTQMVAELRRRAGADFDFELCQVSEVERTVSGKHRWLITTLPEGRLV